MVSNHGGRQLDYSPATLDMIAPIRAAVGQRVPLLMDGGIRRGTDVLKVTLHSTPLITTIAWLAGQSAYSAVNASVAEALDTMYCLVHS